MSLEPTLHKPIPMESRVLVPAHYCGVVKSGTVVGIASCHLIFNYIVLLDEPHNTEFGTIRAVSVAGSLLTGTDGSHWRLDDQA